MIYSWFANAPAATRPAVPAVRVVYIVDADQSYDVRWRVETDDLVIFRTLEGEGRLWIGDNAAPPLEATPGTLIMIRGRKIRRYLCFGERWKFLWFRFECPDAAPLPEDRALFLPDSEGEEKSARRCIDCLREKNPLYWAGASALLLSLLYRWALAGEQAAAVLSPGEEVVKRVIALARDRLDGYWTVGKMAKATRLSERRLRQLFVQHVGEPPTRYYHRLQLEAAADLLLSSRLSVKELAERFGYRDGFHFSKAFKNRFGVSPSDYRGRAAAGAPVAG